MLKTFWYRRSIRTQLLVAIGVINLCALLVAGAISVLDARKATRVEVEAALEIAKRFVRVTIEAVAPDGRIDDLSEKIAQLSSRLQLAHLRHVRILMADATGQLVQLSPQEPPDGPPADAAAPRWFTALVEPDVAPRELSVVQADPYAGGVMIIEEPANVVPKIWNLGTIVIAGAPADEIAEAWHDVSSLALVWLGLDALVLAVLFLLFRRMLDPLAQLAQGMSQLEDGNYSTRVGEPRVRELAAIAGRFNHLAEALGRSRAENARLYGQLITVQEDERREIANELHDEASPCLFGMMANALSIQKLLGRRSDARTASIKRHVAEILKVNERLKVMNRMMLKKLRPVALGRVAVSALIDDLVAELGRRYPEVRIAYRPSLGMISYGEAIDLTLYRCVHEAVINAIRHGKAENVKIELLIKARNFALNGQADVQLIVQDDGCGVGNRAELGLGLTVMRERVQALAGSCLIQNAKDRGTVLSVAIPVPAPRTRRADEMEIEHAA